MANLAWAKNAVLVAAEREIEYESRVADTLKKPSKTGVFLEHQGDWRDIPAGAMSDTGATIAST
jgi:hypothetical protein